LIEQLQAVSSATASATLHKMGVRHTYMHGPLPRTAGRKVVGPAVTLQFMPQREDIASGLGQEHAEKVSALWAVFETVEPGDVLVVQAFGDPSTGCMGEMLTTYFKGRGGAGIVVDGCVRDWPNIRELNVPLWTVGFTPNYASQAGLFPWAYNVPIACGRVLVLPGDIVIADDDGAVLVPKQLAHEVARVTLVHEAWEEFSRIKLAEGGALRKYYPLNDEGWREYEEWRRARGEA
jgi:regulator of RNase E activity RraA